MIYCLKLELRPRPLRMSIVGLCGIYFHVLATLLFLKPFYKNDKKILELTPKEQLQK